MPQIAILVPTRNRGAQAAETAKAVLASDVDLELVVVDQSTNDDTRRALEPLTIDPRFRFLTVQSSGISEARNAGVAATSAPIIAFTDDDCRPDPGWVSSILDIFVKEPNTSLVCGRVHLPPGAHVEGYAASFEPIRRVHEGGVPTPDAGLGIGANLAVRRRVLDQLGGFDPLLGVGAPFFRAGEDVDIVIRALHAGYRVVNAVECDVLHVGVRTGPAIRPLAVGYQIAMGAALGKHARLAGSSGLRDVLRWAYFYGHEAITRSTLFGRSRLGVPFYFLAGVLLTFRYRIDREHQAFASRG